MSEKNVAVVGAGLCGSLLGVYFAQNGYNVDVFEYRKDLRGAESAGGRSINMALSHRGISALKKVDLYNRVQPHLIAMKGRMIHLEDGQTTMQPYGVDKDHVIYSISRKVFNEILLDAADQYENINLFFEKKCVGYDYEKKNLKLKDVNSSEVTNHQYDYIFGTDGAFSQIRKSMMKQDRFNYAQSYISHGYKELSIPSGTKEKFLLEPNALHIWPRKQFMLIALPNTDGSFTCTLFLHFEGEQSFSKLQTRKDVTRFFQTFFPDAYKLFGDVEDQFFDNPTSSLVTIHCSPWNVDSHTLLLGDAAHAIVPFFGQGMNASFEDVELFFDQVDRLGLDESIQTFCALRKDDTDAIAKMALENFIEMRDLVSDPDYIERRTLAQKLEKQNPEQFQSRYTMVSFTSMPYAKVYEQGQKNQKVIEDLLASANSPTQT